MPTEFSEPTAVACDDDFTVTAMLHRRAADHPGRLYCEYKDVHGRWVPLTLSELRDQVLAVAKGIVALGVQPGDAVGLQASTRYEWALLDFAILAAGAVSVPIYPSSSAAQIAWIREDADLKLMVVETRAQRDTAAAVDGMPTVLTIAGDDDAVAHLVRAGSTVSDDDLAARTSGVRLDDVASIVYTSGTTGNPKGVELTHRNLVEHAVNAAAYPHLLELTSPEKRILLFLPLAHVLARHLEILTLASGMTIGFAPSPATLPADLRSFRPDWMLAVPRVLEAFYNTAEARAGSGVKRRLFRWSAGVARAVGAARASGRVGPWLALKRLVADRLVLHKIREAMGGQMSYIVAGGAKLSPHLAHFYAGVGVSVLEGYGLTESSAPATCNPQHAPRVGTVGPPLPGCSVRIAEDGEVQLKGAHIFAGYRHRPDATAEVMHDGWFSTGDLGSLDDDGYLRITGRKKEIIVTDAGKNVQPAALEDAIRPDPIVQEVVVVGDGKPVIGALISLDPQMLATWLAAEGLEPMEIRAAADHPRVKAHLKALVDAANEGVSSAEKIRKWRVLPRPLDEEHGEFSASLKVRRHIVMDNFSEILDEMYAAPRREASRS